MDHPAFPSPDDLPSLSRANETLLRKLEQKKFREETGLFVVEGVRLLEEALSCGLTVEWAVSALAGTGPEGGPARALDLVESLRGRGIPVYRAVRESLRRALDTVTPQPLAAVCRIPRADLSAWRAPERAMVAVCDRLNQPGNLGSLVRVALASGAAAVLTSPGTVDPWNPKCVRGAMGALFRLPVFPFADDSELSDFLARENFTLFAAAVGGEDVFTVESFPARTAVVFGSEAQGVGLDSELPGRRTLSVPMAAGVESLNVAVAAGIILYQVGRRQ